MGAPADLVVQVDPPWWSVPLPPVDLKHWADDTATAALAAAGESGGRRQLARQLRGTAEGLAGQPVWGAWFLVPEPAAGAACLATLVPMDLEGATTDVDELLTGLTLELARQAAPPLRTEVQTGLGPAWCLHQRLDGGPGRGPIDSVQYLWAFADLDAGLLLGTTFLDVLESQRWSDQVLALAQSVSPAAPQQLPSADGQQP